MRHLPAPGQAPTRADRSQTISPGAPGGRIAIIDKNAEQWGRLETPEWERWFTRAELEGLLARHCRQVTSRFISYWEDVEPDGLFLAWLAVK